jgi:hypothetical protein
MAIDARHATASRPEPASRPVLWTQVEPGFHVAGRDGEFVGYVDTSADGTFVAFDGTSALVGRYPRLSLAKDAVIAASTRSADTASPTPARRIVFAATAVTALTGILLIAGVLDGVLR